MKIPKAAMPVVRVLRRDVKRPMTLPDCPMGLHVDSSNSAPCCAEHFAGGCCTQKAVSAFWRWWDRLEAHDIPAAMDAIWPRKKKVKANTKKGC